MVPARLLPRPASHRRSPVTRVNVIRASLLCSVILLLVLGALFFTPAAPLHAQGQPVFRAGTELVRLDVSITDKDGHPVADVRPEEVEVSENGRRLPILLFRHLADTQDREAARPAAFEEVSANGTSSPGHLYVMLFDQAHMLGGREQRVRQAAERFLSRTVRPGDGVAIYALPGPGPTLNFTSDLAKARTRLLELRGQAERRGLAGLREYDAYKAVRSGGREADMSTASRAMPAPPGEGAPDERVLRTFASQVVSSADTRTHVFLKQATEVMRGLRSIEGRKVVLLFSEGFFGDNAGPQLEEVASAAAQSHSVVYPIDLNAPASELAAAERAERTEPLARLASETNGSLVATGDWDLDRALGAIVAQANDYYLVGFQPAASNAGRDYHRVKVTVGRPGLVARARTGYSTTPMATPIGGRQAIDVALSVPRTSSALPIEYTTYERGGPVADTPRIIASVSAHVPRCSNDDRTVEVVFIVRDAVTGQAAASGTDRVHVAAAPGHAPAALDPVNYSVQFDVPPGEYWMRVLVREPGGVIGTADRRFHVWPLGGAGVTTSDLIVSRLDGNRFDPPAHASVSHRDAVLAYLEIYGTADAAHPVDATVDIVSAESNQVVATAAAIVKDGPRGEKIVRAQVPVDKLAAGFYAARVRVMVPNQAPRTVVRNFKVVSDQTGTNE